ncbi:hypothetical protein JCM6882_008744 [Rhodosporidiobolus microsporus]
MARRAKARDPTPEPSEPAESANEEESSDEEEVYVEPNLATRARRNNAGNRMQALIEDEAQAEVEDMFKEEENDEEFAQKEEKDEFDSDFGSTDEGEGDEEDDEEAGERKLQREAKEAKKAAASKKKRGFQAPVHPFARQTKAQRAKAASASAEASTSATTLDDEEKPAKKRRKSATAAAVDPAFLLPQRESSRRTAVESRRQVQDRIKETEQKKAVAPKPVKKAQVTLTQADLIAEALETEEVNRAALLAFYAAEEDRREMERIAGMRYEIIGAKITFLSRTEGRRAEDVKGKGKKKEEAGRKRLIEVIGESGKKGWKAGAAQSGAARANGDSAAAPTASTSKPPTRHSLRNILNSPAVSPPAPDPEPTPSTPPERPEYTRNWLIFGNTDEEPITRGQELEAIFGEHEDWTREAPLPAKTVDGVEGRGYLCPITGLPAKYRDPRTLTPYATLAAYKILSSLTDAQTAVYSDSLGAYTGNTGMPGGVIREVEASWARRPGAKAAAAAVAAATGAGAAAPGGVAPRFAAASPSIAPPSRPMVGTPTQVLPSPSPAPSASGSTGTGTGKKPRAPRQSVSADNPYKIEYAHAGGSGRGQRGRGSLDGAAGAAEGMVGEGAYQYVPPQGGVQPGTPHHPQHPYAAHQQHQQHYQQAQNPYAFSGVYSPSPMGGSPSPFQQHQQQQHPYAYPPQQPHASLVGTSSAPQARSISFGARTGGDPFGGGGGGSPHSPYGHPPPQHPHHPHPHPPSPFHAHHLPPFPPASQPGAQGAFVLPALPTGGALPGLPPLPGGSGMGGAGGGGGA